MKVTAKKIFGIGGWVLIGGVAGAFAQDVMQQRLPFLKVVAEDDKVRVLRYAPATGDKSAMHSHPEAVVVEKLTITKAASKLPYAQLGSLSLRPSFRQRRTRPQAFAALGLHLVSLQRFPSTARLCTLRESALTQSIHRNHGRK